MKNLQKVFMALCVMGLMISCGGSGGGSTPEKVAEKFVESLLKGDLDGMMQCSSKENKEKMSDDKDLKQMLGFFKEAGKEVAGIKAVETNLKEDGESGVVIVELTNKEGKADRMKVSVEKEDGKWVVESMKIK